MSTKKSTAVSLSGGGTCGHGEIAAACQLMERGGVDVWQGTSIGGPIAVCAANNLSMLEMIEAVFRLWHPSRRSWRKAVLPQGINLRGSLKGDRRELRKLASFLGLLDPTEHMKEWCEEFHLEWNNARLVLFDLISRKIVYVDADFGMPLHLALRSTIAVPGIFTPQPWTDESGREYLFVDGGMGHLSPTVEGHKTTIVKCLKFPLRDRIFPDTKGDETISVDVVPGLSILFPPSREKIRRQIEEARGRLPQENVS